MIWCFSQHWWVFITVYNDYFRHNQTQSSIVHSMSQILKGGRGSEAKHKCPKCECPKEAMDGVGGLSDVIGTMSLTQVIS